MKLVRQDLRILVESQVIKRAAQEAANAAVAETLKTLDVMVRKIVREELDSLGNQGLLN